MDPEQQLEEDLALPPEYISSVPPLEIRTIEAESVRRLVAGQAVTDLASAVKELVDNALDAGAQNINSTCFIE